VEEPKTNTHLSVPYYVSKQLENSPLPDCLKPVSRPTLNSHTMKQIETTTNNYKGSFFPMAIFSFGMPYTRCCHPVIGFP
jgi:hypothetical protein